MRITRPCLASLLLMTTACNAYGNQQVVAPSAATRSARPVQPGAGIVAPEKPATGAVVVPVGVEATASPTVVATSPFAPDGASTAPSDAPRRPLNYYGTLIDYDGVANWVAGEVVEGPLHINRGPVPAGVKWAGADVEGRSRFNLWLTDQPNSPFVRPPGGADFPIFQGPVSLGYDATADQPAESRAIWSHAHWLGGNAGVAGTAPDGSQLIGPPVRWSEIFAHPDNAKALNGGPGPILTRDVPLPRPFATRVGEVLGLAPGAEPASLPWFGPLRDGVYVPTDALVSGRKNGYTANEAVSGGIYVRGTVEVLRAAVVGDSSYVMLQVGYPGGDAHRSYIVRLDRKARTLTLTALPPGRLLPQALGEVEGDPARLEAEPATEAESLEAWSIAGAGTLRRRFVAADRTRLPFNGIIGVDYGASDPLRDPAAPGRLLPATATRRPLTGHILALGDPDVEAKRPLAGAAAGLPPLLQRAEVFSTEVVDGSAAPAATGLTIAAVGSVFVQNHLLVEGVARRARGAGVQRFEQAMRATVVTARDTEDRLAVWADRRVFIGLAAPSAPSRDELGLLLTASLVGLEDPARTDALIEGRSYPAVPQQGLQPVPVELKYLGSISAEGTGALYGLQTREHPEIGTGAGGRVAAMVGNSDRALNPIHQPWTNSGWAPRGRLVSFGARIMGKRGTVGAGILGYDKDFRHDARLEGLPLLR
jgi:hypothetical protein